jgi:integrase
MNDITKDQDLKEIGKQIAAAAPSLKDLTDEQLKEVSSWYLQRKLTDEMTMLVNASKLDQDENIRSFLAIYDSLYTKKTYFAAFTRLKDFCKIKNIDFISLTPALADDWILSERQSGRAAASIRKDVAAISSFFTFLERRYDFIKNPFRGTKSRPKNKAVKKLEIPDQKDFQTVINNIPKELSVIVHLMGVTGLRAGAFEHLSIYDNILTTETKGKEFKLSVSDFVVNLIKNNDLPLSQPFKSWKAYKIENLLRYYTEKLYSAGMIKAIYSAHDFRHFFAVTEYKEHKDIYRLSRLLNHSSIQTTQNYLRSLNFEV